MTKPSNRTRQVVVEELATAAVDLAEIALRVGRLTGELDGIDAENRQAAMLRSKPDPLFIPLKEAAGIAGVTPETMKALCKEHDFGWRRIGEGGRPGHWIVSRDHFLEWLKLRAKTVRRGSTPRNSQICAPSR